MIVSIHYIIVKMNNFYSLYYNIELVNKNAVLNFHAVNIDLGNCTYACMRTIIKFINSSSELIFDTI